MLLALASTALPQAENFPVGQPVEKVVCQASPSHSYALYLPSAYTPEKKWPILYAFDPRKRGMIPLELFREGAEKHGYIIASSNDFMSDTPTLDDAMEAMRGLWNDTTSRFSIDPKRIYSTGFSGGARFS